MQWKNPDGSLTLGVVLEGRNGDSLPSIEARSVGTANITVGQSVIGTGATSIVGARTGAAGIGRVSVTIYNNGSATVFVGGSGVTTNTGLPLLPGGSITIATTAAVYGIVASGTVSCAYLENY